MAIRVSLDFLRSPIYNWLVYNPVYMVSGDSTVTFWSCFCCAVTFFTVTVTYIFLIVALYLPLPSAVTIFHLSL